MNRVQRAAVLAHLIEALRARGSWCGETHLQKGVFFLQKMLGSPLEFDFILYRHGPFSFDLRDELTSLRADEILSLEPQAPPYGPKFCVTPVGRSLQVRYPRTLREQEGRIEFVADLFGSKGVNELERLATALYATLELGQGATREERARLLHEFKAHVPLEEARQAVATLDEVREEVASRFAFPTE